MKLNYVVVELLCAPHDKLGEASAGNNVEDTSTCA